MLHLHWYFNDITTHSVAFILKNNVISIDHEQRSIEISILRRWNNNGDFSIRSSIYWYIRIFALHYWFWCIVNATTSYCNCNEWSIEKAMLFQHECNGSILKMQWNINMFSMTRHTRTFHLWRDSTVTLRRQERKRKLQGRRSLPSPRAMPQSTL